MPLFACSKCKCQENSATCHYWSAMSDCKAPLCSACDPEIGKWHGIFKRKTAVGMYVDDRGTLWSPEAVAGLGITPSRSKILGVVL